MAGQEKKLLLFSAKEKAGIVAILLLNIIIRMIPEAYEKLYQQRSPELISVISLQQDSVLSEAEPSSFRQHDSSLFRYTKKPQNDRLFFFDPNNCSDSDWKQLGLNSGQIRSIEKYRSKVGGFLHASDFGKIRCIGKLQMQKLLPFVRIRVAENNAAGFNKPITKSKQNIRSAIDINTADSVTLESLPGIGPALSSRIIRYRDKLGGFYEVSQLKEVWGLTDSVFGKVQSNFVVRGEVVKIDLNQADFKKIAGHPYIGYQSAKALIAYRNQHGKFESLEEIQKIILIDEKSFGKALHYLFVK